MSEHEFVKPGILIASHGDLCVGIQDSARMIGMSLDNVVAKPLREGVSPATYESELREVLNGFPPGSIVLIDLFGGTPFNVLAKILPDYPEIHAAAGLNLPMLLEVCGACNFMKGQELIQSALNAGREGVVDINHFVNTLLSTKAEEDDEDI
ncbi:MAG: PTS sugar transporter subunit IIA [Erysipelotrichaceae bacterium]|nr:PTS sugar transporter subunit IIA [Erysipelotrichaceae bacterium]